jgi:hypothetical protein
MQSAILFEPVHSPLRDGVTRQEFFPFNRGFINYWGIKFMRNKLATVTVRR